MSNLSLKFKVQSSKAICLALAFKPINAFHLRSFIARCPALHPPGRSTSVQKCSRHFCAFICVFCFFNPAFADQPDIRDLDRMFTTRFERAQLDALRRRMSTGEDMNANATNNAAPAPVNVEMQGIMQREKGGNVAWINGQSTLKSNTIGDNIRVKGQPKALSGANVSIDGQTVRLKPGQVWQQEDGKVVERYKTKVAEPVTKGADEAAADVQTGKSDNTQAATQPPVKQP